MPHSTNTSTLIARCIIIEKSKRRDDSRCLCLTNLVCVLFDPAIPTSSFNFIVFYTCTIRIALNNSSGDIVYAQYGCAAGSGPTGSCKHIAAKCYALEDFCHIRQLCDHVPCTSQLQTWNQPRKRTLDSADIEEIKFIKMEYGKMKCKPTVVPYDPRPVPLRCTTAEEILSLRQALESKGSDIALLHVLPGIVSSQGLQLPLIPRSSQERIRHLLVTQLIQPVSIRDIVKSWWKC